VSLQFHLIWNDADAWLKGQVVSLSEALMSRNKALMESIFYHHPKAQVNVYSNTLPKNYYSQFEKRGFALKVVRFDILDWAKDTPAEGSVMTLKDWSKEKDWVINLSDLLRLLILFKEGGVYLDFTDTLVLQPLNQLVNAIGWEHHGYLGTGVMKFEKGFGFIEKCIEEYFENYNSEVWANQGPILITRTYEKEGFLLNIDFPVSTFYPIHWKKSSLFYYSNHISEELTAQLIRQISDNTIVLHYYGTSQKMENKSPDAQSVLGYFLGKYKVLS